ncbi:MAG: peptide synthetase, partial [Candidatus Limivicinus sp.]
YTPFSSRNRLLELREAMHNPELRACYPTGNIEADIKVYELEDEPSRRLLEFSREHRIPVAVILLLGMRTVFSKFAGGEKDVSVKNAVARRGTLLESQSGGTRLHFWPLRTVIEPETSFMDALKIVQAKENALLKHANYDPMRYMGEVGAAYGAPQGASYECTTLTYQPMSAAALKGHNIPDMKFKSMWYTNGVAMQHIYVTVMHRPTDNGFSFHFEYQKNEVSEDELEKFYFYLCRTLFYGMEDPNRTIGEILAWI